MFSAVADEFGFSGCFEIMDFFMREHMERRHGDDWKYPCTR